MISLNDNLGGGPEQDPAPATGDKTSINPLDTANHFEVVATQPSELPIWIKKIDWHVSRDEALNLAAWLIVTATIVDKGDLLSAVKDLRIIVERIQKS